MKKQNSLCLILGVCIVFSSCVSPRPPVSSMTPSSESAESKHTTSTIQQTDATTGTIQELDKTYKLIHETEFYKDYAEVGGIGSYYEVYNTQGEQIDSGFSEKSIGIELSGPYVVISQNGGTFTPVIRYCDITNSRISKWYTAPLAISGEYIVCLGTRAIFIQHIFRDDTYRKEVGIDFSSPMQVEAEFIENGTQLKVTYPIAPDDRKVTITIPIE